jgi:hypothetical protein
MCALYIVISCAWPCDIVAVNATQNNNNAGTRIRTLQLIEFTYDRYPNFGDEGEKPVSSPEMESGAIAIGAGNPEGAPPVDITGAPRRESGRCRRLPARVGQIGTVFRCSPASPR